jgi:hypothetical protein
MQHSAAGVMSQARQGGIMLQCVERLNGMYIPVEHLNDQSLLALTELHMVEAQSKRLSVLLGYQKAGKLTASEQVELQALIHIYEDKMLRRSLAIIEAVRRGLIPPPGTDTPTTPHADSLADINTTSPAK